MADGTFLKKNTISNDKLLEQLIGKKKAKAHLAAKQQAERAGAQQVPKTGRRPVAKKEESDDEEEGRAATFKSKRRRVGQPKQPVVSDEGLEENGTELDVATVDEAKEQETEAKASHEDDGDSDTMPAKAKPKPLPTRGRPKATSYLDEILAERSKKKKNKLKNQTAEA